MPGMPEQCRTMMQGMPSECMNAMQQMMQGGMMQGMMAAPDAAHAGENRPDFTRAYVDAMDAMHGPMMEGVMADDPDTAFVRGMIPHHQGAIAMAKIVQQYGDDPETRGWAARIVEAQEGEIVEMQAWLATNAGEAPTALGQTGGTVYSANEGGNSISAIDLGTGSVETVDVGVSPHNVDLTPDGNLLLAVGSPAADHAHGSDDDGHADTDAGGGVLVVLDPERLSQPVATVEVGAHPAHVVADRSGRAYASLSGGNEIAVVDLAQAEVIERIATGAYPHGLRLAPPIEPPMAAPAAPRTRVAMSGLSVAGIRTWNVEPPLVAGLEFPLDPAQPPDGRRRDQEHLAPVRKRQRPGLGQRDRVAFLVGRAPVPAEGRPACPGKREADPRLHRRADSPAD